MRRHKKGQSAMEYLMTYGWAILIVIIAGGVIWYYASQGTTAGGAVKGGFSNIDVDSPWSVNPAGTLSMKAINKVGKDVTIDAIYVNGVSKTIAPTTVTVSSGATSAWIDVTSAATAGSSGSSYKLDSVAIQYYLGTDTSKKFNSTGTMSGTRS